MQGMLLRSTTLEKRGWKMKWEVVTLVEYSEYDYKGTKTEENQGQSFVSGERLGNVWYKHCIKAWK